MSYTRIDDGILTHPKMADAEELCPVYAWVLWTKALVYVNQHKLDGRVTRKVAGRLIGADNVGAAIEALVSTGLWDEDEDGYRFHDFTEHNATRDQRAEKAKKNADAQAAHREKAREEKRLARLAKVSADAEKRKQPVSDDVSAYEKTRKVAPLHSTPLQSTPLSLHSEAEAERDPEPVALDPTEVELFTAYAHGLNQATGCLSKPQKTDVNATALSTVWVEFGHPTGQSAAEFLDDLAERVCDYVADAKRRKQPPTFEAGYSPKRFLDWLRATKDGLDPFPRAPLAADGSQARHGGKAANGGGMSSPYGNPTADELRAAGAS